MQITSLNEENCLQDNSMSFIILKDKSKYKTRSGKLFT